MFGYPEYAVEFFVAAGQKQAETKQFVACDFVHLPTFASDEGRFVYAVPKGHAERAEDRLLKATTAEVFTRYRAWRLVDLERNKLPATELLRNWIAPPAISFAPPVSWPVISCVTAPPPPTFPSSPWCPHAPCRCR